MERFDTVAALIHIIPEWIELVCLTFCIGTLACRLLVLEDESGTCLPSRRDLFDRIWRFVCIAAAAMAASSVGDLLVRAGEMSGLPFTAVFSVLPTILFRTHLGHVWIIRFSAIICLFIAPMVCVRIRWSRRFAAFLLAVCGVIAFTRSASGHASDAGDFSIAEIVDWLHLMAASFWGGGLLVLSVAILPKLSGHGCHPAMALAGVARRFSCIAGIAIGIVAITSLYNVWAFVGSVAALRAATYGWVVAVKTALFLLLACLGALNRYIEVPLLQECAGLSPNDTGMIAHIVSPLREHFSHPLNCSRIAQRFMRAVRAEALLVALVLLCASLLRHEIPASHYSNMQRAGTNSSISSHAGRNPHNHNQ